MKKLRILLTPLDWGLGHATRCVPIIRSLQKHNIEVLIGASGNIAHLLQKEFPEIKIIPLAGYGISYAKRSRFFMYAILFQLPKILYSAWKENKKTKKIIVDFQIDAIISDNRLGCFHKKLPSVYITHQLQILTGNKFLDGLAMKANYFFINKYSECWVPDTEGEINLAGVLSHPKLLPKIPIKYLGQLSRFSYHNLPVIHSLTILISGPEPQRTIFEKLIVKQAEDFDMPLMIIRGLPDSNAILISLNKKLEYRNHLNAAELSCVLHQSEMIIARSGYSTVMDLMALEKKAILIPTPGQTEQEYLSKKLAEQRLFYTVSQDEFNLKKNTEAATLFPYRKRNFISSLDNVIENWKLSIE